MTYDIRVVGGKNPDENNRKIIRIKDILCVLFYYYFTEIIVHNSNWLGICCWLKLVLERPVEVVSRAPGRPADVGPAGPRDLTVVF